MMLQQLVHYQSKTVIQVEITDNLATLLHFAVYLVLLKVVVIVQLIALNDQEVWRHSPQLGKAVIDFDKHVRYQQRQNLLINERDLVAK